MYLLYMSDFTRKKIPIRSPTPYPRKSKSRTKSRTKSRSKSRPQTSQSTLAHYYQNLARYYKSLGKIRRTNLIINHPNKKLEKTNISLVNSSAFLNLLAFDPSVFDIYVNEYTADDFFKDYMVPLTNGVLRSEKNPLDLIQKIRRDKGQSAMKNVKSFLPNENIIDIHVYIMICALVYHNKPMKQFLSVFLNEPENDIDHAIQYTISPYIRTPFRGGKNTLIGKMIKLLFIIFNMMMLSFLIYYANQSTHQMIDLIYSGKTANAILNIKDAIEILNSMETCVKDKTDSPKSHELLGWLLPKESVDTYGKFLNAYQCVSTQEKSFKVIGELVMMYNPMDYETPKEEEDEEKEDEEKEDEEKEDEDKILLLNAPVIQYMPTNELTKSIPIPDLFALTVYEAKTIPGFDTISEKSLATMNQNILKIQEKAMQFFLPAKATKNNFKAGLNFLDELTDDDLANKILDDELLGLYNKHKYVNTGTITQDTVNVKPTDYLSQITNTVVYKQASLIAALAGSAVYEMIVTPSHTPVFDMIAMVRAKINAFSRSMRDAYNKNEDLLNDVISELVLIYMKSKVAWSRAIWIARFGTIFIGQVLDYIYDVVPIQMEENILKISLPSFEPMLLEDKKKRKGLKSKASNASDADSKGSKSDSKGSKADSKADPMDSLVDMFRSIGPLRS